MKTGHLWVASLLLAGLASATYAQQRVIEEVIVTAQKTKQSIQDVPISVTALDGGFIQDAAINDLRELSVYVPNVRIDANDPGSPQIFIRGFGTNTFNPSFESSVGLVQDEVFFGRAAYFTEAMFDIDRIEVLRGPQGTLFGKNTVAGVFNVASRPVTPEWEGNIEYRRGQHGEKRLEGGIGGMVTDWFGLRLSALDWKKDGQLVNTFLDRFEENIDQSAQRLKLLFSPSDSFELELFGVRSQSKLNYWPQQLKNLSDDTRAYLQNFDADIEDDPKNFKTSFDTPGTLRKRSQTVGARALFSLGRVGPFHNLDMVVVAADTELKVVQLQDLDVSPANIGMLFNDERYEQQTVEWRFSGDSDGFFGIGDSIEFVAGLFYFRSDYLLDASVKAGSDLASYLLTEDAQRLALGENLLPTGAFVDLLDELGALGVFNNLTANLIGDDDYQFDYSQKTDTLALFGQFSWYFGERLVITPGLRVNHERKRVNTAGTARCELKAVIDTCVMGLLLGANDYNERGLKRRERDVSPKLSVMYYLTEDINVFVTASKGFKSGGFNSISFTGEDLEFKAENVRTIEIGSKGRFFNRSLNVNATIYRTELDDLQVLAFSGVFFDVSNAAAATSEGLEVDFQWLTPWEPLSIMGSFGLLDARYDSYPDAPAPISEGVEARQDLSGRRIAFAPKRMAVLSPTLEFTVLGDAQLRLGLDVIHQGEQFTDTDLDPNTRVDANTQYNLRMSLSDAAQRWRLTLAMKNATDKLTQNQVVDAVFFPGAYYAQQNPGRQFYGSVSYNW